MLNDNISPVAVSFGVAEIDLEEYGILSHRGRGVCLLRLGVHREHSEEQWGCTQMCIALKKCIVQTMYSDSIIQS